MPLSELKPLLKSIRRRVTTTQDEDEMEMSGTVEADAASGSGQSAVPRLALPERPPAFDEMAASANIRPAAILFKRLNIPKRLSGPPRGPRPMPQAWAVASDGGKRPRLGRISRGRFVPHRHTRLESIDESLDETAELSTVEAQAQLAFQAQCPFCHEILPRQMDLDHHIVANHSGPRPDVPRVISTDLGFDEGDDELMRLTRGKSPAEFFTPPTLGNPSQNANVSEGWRSAALPGFQGTSNISDPRDPREPRERPPPRAGFFEGRLSEHHAPRLGRPVLTSELALPVVPSVTLSNARSEAGPSKPAQDENRDESCSSYTFDPASVLDMEASQSHARQESIASIMSDKSALEARMARHLLALSSSQGSHFDTASLYSSLCSSDAGGSGASSAGQAPAGRVPEWSRPWKRQGKQGPGVWLCGQCEHRDDVDGALRRMGVSPPLTRMQGQAMLQRKCACCCRSVFCKLFAGRAAEKPAWSRSLERCKYFQG